jgi:RNA polymerase sigma-70 factor (ECF subfamily)
LFFLSRRHPDARIQRLLAADPLAIDQAYREHHAALRAFAQRLVGDRAAAEDLVHDVFLSLPRALRSYRSEGTLRAFLIGVAANRCGRYVRAAARRRNALSKLEQEKRNTPLAAPDEALRARVLRALDSLPLAQRTALVLCAVEERTAAEVAQILSVPEATVRTRCFHARKKLMHLLREEVP